MKKKEKKKFYKISFDNVTQIVELDEKSLKATKQQFKINKVKKYSIVEQKNYKVPEHVEVQKEKVIPDYTFFLKVKTKDGKETVKEYTDISLLLYALAKVQQHIEEEKRLKKKQQAKENIEKGKITPTLNVIKNKTKKK